MLDLWMVSDLVRKKVQEGVNVEQGRTPRSREGARRTRKSLALPVVRLVTHRGERRQEPCMDAAAR
jgi:hypothetical protein